MTDEQVNKAAWKIYEVLKAKGCGIGNVSVVFIEKELEAFASRVRADALKDAAGACHEVYKRHKRDKSYPADMGGLAKECAEEIGKLSPAALTDGGRNGRE